MALTTPNLLVTGGAGFIGSNLTLALQEKFPDARLTVLEGAAHGLNIERAEEFNAAVLDFLDSATVAEPAS